MSKKDLLIKKKNFLLVVRKLRTFKVIQDQRMSLYLSCDFDNAI